MRHEKCERDTLSQSPNTHLFLHFSLFSNCLAHYHLQQEPTRTTQCESSKIETEKRVDRRAFTSFDRSEKQNKTSDIT